MYILLTGAAYDTNDQPKITNLRKDDLGLHPIPTTQQESTRQVRSSTLLDPASIHSQGSLSFALVIASTHFLFMIYYSQA